MRQPACVIRGWKRTHHTPSVKRERAGIWLGTQQTTSQFFFCVACYSKNISFIWYESHQTIPLMTATLSEDSTAPGPIMTGTENYNPPQSESPADADKTTPTLEATQLEARTRKRTIPSTLVRLEELEGKLRAVITADAKRSEERESCLESVQEVMKRITRRRERRKTRKLDTFQQRQNVTEEMDKRMGLLVNEVANLRHRLNNQDTTDEVKELEEELCYTLEIIESQGKKICSLNLDIESLTIQKSLLEKMLEDAGRPAYVPRTKHIYPVDLKCV